MNIDSALGGGRPAVLDGAMGTELQRAGLLPGETPELWNLSRPDAVRSVHRAYFDAGAGIVYANTFGANSAKYRGDAPLADVIAAGVALAREAAPRGGLVALDVGPTGRLLSPAGDFPFDAAYDAFAGLVQAGARAGADLVAVETMGDTYELKAAVLAARENSDLPVIATASVGEDGRLLTGADVDTLAALFAALRPDAAGFNCGLGPDRLLPLVRRLAERIDIPIVVKANAGLPRVSGGRTVFDVGPEEFARGMAACIEAGASIVGGCCGTTPAHIRALSAAVAALRPARRAPVRVPCAVSSGSRCVDISPDDSVVIGERINPTGRKRLREAYRSGDTAYVLREAIAQADAGAHILDVNAGVPGIDEPRVLRATVESIQGVVDLPLQIDTSDPAALDAALRHYNGRALVNSVNGREESMSAVFPAVAKYGGVVVALTLDENGIPPTADGRLAIARRIVERGAKYGLGRDDFLVDVLCLAVSADPASANVILESVRRVRGELGVRTVLGVSNISFGLPSRPALNASFYTLALGAGLTAAIVNPLSAEMMTAYRSWRALAGRDAACADWIAYAPVLAASAPAPASAASAALSPQSAAGNETPLAGAVRRGLLEDAASIARALLAEGASPVSVIDSEIVPALERVGSGFERGSVFLPQLLMAAEAAGAAFGVVREALGKSGAASRARGTVILATVRGDIHDIGKNIVRALLENYGFRVVDLGRDVAPEAVVEAALREKCRLVGLSALMTTTTGAMAETVRLLAAADPEIRTFVGGAVLTPEYAAEIGATWYARDAMSSVRIAERFYS